MAGDFDLWGDPVPEPVENRGRPKHEVTEEKRLRVSVLAAHGMTHDDIAAAMGISAPTLRKNYLRELRGGLAQKRAELLVLKWKAAAGGNVSAMKEVQKDFEKADMYRGHIANHTGKPAEKPVKPPKLGKKEQALADAQQPDTSTSMGDLMAQRMASTVKPH